MKYRLEVDVGNSFCKWRIRAGQDVVVADRVSTHQLTGLFSAAAQYAIETAQVCSVASAGHNAKLVQEIASVWAVRVDFFKVQSRCAGLTNSYTDFSKMGADRWLAAIGAKHKYPDRELCVVDCGSAINVEFVSKAAVHTGGFIMPGLLMMQRALLHNTEQVDAMHNDLSIVPGINTGENVSHGCLYMMLALVEKLARQMQERDGQLLVAGGDAGALMALLDSPEIIWEKNLVLDGFAFLQKTDMA